MIKALVYSAVIFFALFTLVLGVGGGVQKIEKLGLFLRYVFAFAVNSPLQSVVALLTVCAASQILYYFVKPMYTEALEIERFISERYEQDPAVPRAALVGLRRKLQERQSAENLSDEGILAVLVARYRALYSSAA